MIEIGKFHQLEVVKKAAQGIYLNKAESNEQDLLLPNNQVPEGIEIGEQLEVFVYRDSKDRKIATLKTPKLVEGKVAALQVVSINHIGAFLEWGLERDLFLPFKEQIGRIHKGEVHVVAMYRDKSDRLCATMKIYDKLTSESPYQINDRVKGIIYMMKDTYGAFVAIEGKYHGLIPIRELYGKYKVGDELNLRICGKRTDGKLEVTPRQLVHLQMEEDARKIMEALNKQEGYLPVHDKSTPDEIDQLLHMSKAAFKRAIGRLMKEGVIEIRTDGIKRNW